jgi:hypothetical protein
MLAVCAGSLVNELSEGGPVALFVRLRGHNNDDTIATGATPASPGVGRIPDWGQVLFHSANLQPGTFPRVAGEGWEGGEPVHGVGRGMVVAAYSQAQRATRKTGWQANRQPVRFWAGKYPQGTVHEAIK